MEFAGTLSDFLREDLRKKYPELMKHVGAPPPAAAAVAAPSACLLACQCAALKLLGRCSGLWRLWGAGKLARRIRSWKLNELPAHPG